MALLKCNISSLDTCDQLSWEQLFNFCESEAKYFTLIFYFWLITRVCKSPPKNWGDVTEAKSNVNKITHWCSFKSNDNSL